MFFQDCDPAVAPAPQRSKGAMMRTGSASEQAAYLEVRQVGDYKVSFAPSWVDLDRADPKTFQLSSRMKAVMTQHYPAGEFGFVIYKPDLGGEMHPLGYRHSIGQGDLLFVPTRHEHGHDGPPDWDHLIYHQGNSDHVPATAQAVGWQSAAETFERRVKAGLPVPREIVMGQPLRSIRRKGVFPNEDISIGTARSGSMAAIGLAAATTAAFAAGAAYVARRRQESAKSRSSQPASGEEESR